MLVTRIINSIIILCCVCHITNASVSFEMPASQKLGAANPIFKRKVHIVLPCTLEYFFDPYILKYVKSWIFKHRTDFTENSIDIFVKTLFAYFVLYRDQPSALRTIEMNDGDTESCVHAILDFVLYIMQYIQKHGRTLSHDEIKIITTRYNIENKTMNNSTLYNGE